MDHHHRRRRSLKTWFKRIGPRGAQDSAETMRVDAGGSRTRSIASPVAPVQAIIEPELDRSGRATPSTSSAPAQQTATPSMPQRSEPTSSQRDDAYDDLFREALAQLPSYEKNQHVVDNARDIAKKIIDIKTTGDQPPTVKDLANNIKQEMDEQMKAQKYESRIGGFADKTVSILNKFVSVGDVVASFDPMHAALPWAAVRFVLVNLTAKHALKSQILNGIANATSLVLQCHTYRQLYVHELLLQLSEDAAGGLKAAVNDVRTSIIQAYVRTLLFLGFAMSCEQSSSKMVNAPFRLSDAESYVGSLVESVDQLARAAENCEKYFNHRNQATVRELLKIVGELQSGAQQHSSTINQIDQGVHKIEQNLLIKQLLDIAAPAQESHNKDPDETCLPNTRVELLSQVLEWAGNRDPVKHIFWLNGMAGTGKSTISRTVVQEFARKGYCVARFFFKRGENDRNSASKFVATIAAQLIDQVPAIRPHIANAIDTSPPISGMAMQEQFKKFIREPLAMTPLGARAVVALIVDALDECGNDQDVERLINLFAQTKIESPRLRIFVTSRPELPIRLNFNEEDVKGTYQSLILHNIPESVVGHDLRIFLEYEVARIKRGWNQSVSQDRRLHINWPGEEQIQALVELSIPLFIFASTVCRFLQLRQRGDPASQLKEILGYKMKNHASKLEITYLPVLNYQLTGLSSMEETKVLREFRDIVGPIIVLESPLSASALADLLQLDRNTIENRLDWLHSVLRIPPSSEDPVRLFHLSFRDFLLDPNRRKDQFWIDEKQTHKTLVTACLRVMKQSLRPDICRIQAPGTLASSIEPHKIRDNLHPEVQYACRFWPYHMQQAKARIFDDDEVYNFLHQHFLHWLEALSIIGRVSESLSMIKTLRSITQANSSRTLKFIDDAKRFILTNNFIIRQVPLQLYSSALIFAPKNSVVRTVFEKDIPGWISLLPSVENDWNQCLQTLEGHGNEVTSVIFSNDSTFIASASEDSTIRIWSVETGECQQTFQGHSSAIKSMALSYGSRFIASASSDKTVRIWSIEMGECRHVLDGHSDEVESVVFSSDGNFVASGSLDTTVRIWSAETGECQNLLSGHSHGVRSVAFSRSGLVASGSLDNTVRIWSAETGECRHILSGHVGLVFSVMFSTDGDLVASSSADETVRLWSTKTGKCRRVFSYYTDRIGWVALSPNSKIVAADSAIGCEVRLWSIETGESKYTLEGHKNVIKSLAFSPDSKVLASASADGTVRLWSVETGKCQQILYHSGEVWSVSFSHDGRLVGSGSSDKTVRLWSIETDTLQQALEHNILDIKSKTFLPNDELRRLDGEIRDETIRIWSAETEATQRLLESYNGHTIPARLETLWWQPRKPHRSSIESMKFSPNGRFVLSKVNDSTLRLWSTETGRCLKIIRHHYIFPRSFNFSEDGQYILFSRATISTDGPLQVAFAKRLHDGLSTGRDQTSSLGYSISEHRDWITFYGQDLLWLPAEYRPSNPPVAVFSGPLVALGCALGRTLILRLPTQGVAGL
ncbi:WD40-repeat-containing domain protein [Nemania abortiva]|nr:WD40-repeat-containing domain protein [Nemania abortiva]